MYTILSVAQVFIAVVLIFLVLLHSGKDAGMSGAFGTSQPFASDRLGALNERSRMVPTSISARPRIICPSATCAAGSALPAGSEPFRR